MTAFRYLACVAAFMIANELSAYSRAHAQQAAVSECDENIFPRHGERLSRTLAQGRIYSCGRRVPVSATQALDNAANTPAQCDTTGVMLGTCGSDAHPTQDQFELRYARDGRVFSLSPASTMWSEQPRVTAVRHGTYWVFTITVLEEYYSRAHTDTMVIFSEHGEVFRTTLRECENSGEGYDCGPRTRVTWQSAHQVRTVSAQMPDPSGMREAPEVRVADLRTATPSQPLAAAPAH